MSICTKLDPDFTLLIDDELEGGDRRQVESHLRQCGECRDRFNQQKWFMNNLRNSLPREQASNALRSRIQAIVDESQAPDLTTSRTPFPVNEPQKKVQTKIVTPVLAAAIAACAFVLLITALLLIGTPPAQKPDTDSPVSFAQIAADTHRRHGLGQLPLELSSESTTKVSSWFDGKVPFSVKLPDYQHVSGRENQYSLKGARLIGYKNDYAAYVSYEMGDVPVSLLMTTNDTATPNGGKIVTAKSIDFHYENIAGLRVISWSHRGLTYALVSDFEDANTRQSCIVCHIGVDDPDYQISISL